jgi:hypothetical protein
MKAFASGQIMEMEVGAHAGAPPGARCPDHKPRRAGWIDLGILKLRKWTYCLFGPLVDLPDRSMPSAPDTHSWGRNARLQGR